MPHIPDSVRALERDLQDLFGGRLRSLVVYGTGQPAAPCDDGHGGHHDVPPVHTLAIVDALSADDLRRCAERVEAWHGQGLATPLVIAEGEFEQSLDAFPLEFGAIIDDHAVVAGQAPFVGLRVDPADARRAIETQARSHLIHLREGYLETRARGDALSVLIVRSARPLAGLLAAVARLDGAGDAPVADGPRDIEQRIGAAAGSLGAIVALAHVREITSERATALFGPYFDAFQKLVGWIDGWSD